PRPARSPRAEVERLVARLLDATADADGRGLLLRGEEYQPRTRADFDASVVEPLLRLARLAESAADAVRDNPDQRVRRAAAVLAARAHPLRTALDG
ncbi:MAG TPA: hypothetical protein VGE94_04410, partial [Chloroflexota bacterium]